MQDDVNRIKDVQKRTQTENNTSNTTPQPEQRIQNFNNQVTETISKPKLQTTTIKQVVLFENCSPDQLYETLTDFRRVSAFTNTNCKIDVTEGGEFVLLEGAVTGSITKLIPNKKITQKWRFSDWPENHFSDLTIQLEAEEGGTKLSLTQRKVPSSDSQRTISGWENVFWRKIYIAIAFNSLDVPHKVS